MLKPISVLVLSTLVLTSCGTIRESRVNPINWFGSSTSQPSTVRSDTGGANSLIPPQRRSIFRAKKEAYAGTDVDQITELHVERRPGGAIVRAVGVTQYQGPYDVRLVKLDDQSTGGVLTYALRAEQYRAGSGAAASRSVQAAVWVTDNDLNGVSDIRVVGRSNQRTARR
ncbi:hypothetical protein J4E08_18445 [Sagittula sp. NFXS13]|uniref:Lipoprotein n=1 Tax=Sagittula marina TaxID=943940 RepID=A0A7W6DYG8_9RHOB|nr:hypothetical protein [Sagittula marina]MBB3987629.1 hypothetical protein [Sagittula marina]